MVCASKDRQLRIFRNGNEFRDPLCQTYQNGRHESRTYPLPDVMWKRAPHEKTCTLPLLGALPAWKHAENHECPPGVHPLVHPL